MPIIEVHMLEGRSAECKAKLISALTDACCQALGSKPEAIRVILEEMKLENFGKGGKPFQYQ